MDSVASARLDRCMRICKLKMTRVPDPMVRMSAAATTPGAFWAGALGMPSTHGDLGALRAVYAAMLKKNLVPKASQQHQLSFAALLHGALYCRPLPQQARALQEEVIG
jgi:hypothetical protein